MRLAIPWWIILLVVALTGWLPVDAEAHSAASWRLPSLTQDAGNAGSSAIFHYDATWERSPITERACPRLRVDPAAHYSQYGFTHTDLCIAPESTFPALVWHEEPDLPSGWIARSITTIPPAQPLDLLGCSHLGLSLSYWIEIRVWLSPDPLGFVDGPNLYAYVGNNPWSAFDPQGLQEQSVAPDNIKALRDAQRRSNRTGRQIKFNTSPKPKPTSGWGRALGRGAGRLAGGAGLVLLCWDIGSVIGNVPAVKNTTSNFFSSHYFGDQGLPEAVPFYVGQPGDNEAFLHYQILKRTDPAAAREFYRKYLAARNMNAGLGFLISQGVPVLMGGSSLSGNVEIELLKASASFKKASWWETHTGRVQHWSWRRAKSIGNMKHSLFSLDKRSEMSSDGRYEEVGDYTINKAIRYTHGVEAGSVVYLERSSWGRVSFAKPDFVDYKHHIIEDAKPLGTDPGALEEIEAYYMDVYIEATGHVPTVRFIFYDRNDSAFK